MQYFGFGYNGFGQLIQQSSLHVTAIDTAVKIMNESTLGDDAVENDVSMVTSNWSSISICKGQEVHLQGFIHGKRNQKKSYSSAVPVLDILLTEEDLFILMNDGKSCKVIKYTSTLVEDKIMQIRRLKNSEGDVFEETGLQQITYGDTHMVAVTGRNEAGELEIKDDSYMIFKPFITNIIVKQVSCGKEHVLLLSHSGEVFSYGLGRRVCKGIGDLYMWGWNESGQLGLPMKDPPGNDTERKFGMLGLPNKDPPNKEKETCPDSDTKKHSTDNEIKKDEYEKTQCSENAPNVKEEEMTVT
ncbi:RCC1 domain-containing protein 1-like [Saccoglossus kowalevskii]